MHKQTKVFVTKMAFAFKIDNALKANLYKICRLCGNDQPFMQPIVTMERNKADENANDPSLCKKINQLIGLTVHKHDNMPQSACTACVDKINDFFEFREMCVSTDAQTRKLLGLKTETESLSAQRGRKRKSEELLTVKIEDEKKKKTCDGTLNQNQPFACSICNERFSTGQKFHTHLVIKHSPHVPRYACYACDHTIHVSSEVKNHEMWHKVSKTPFVCGFCNAKLMNKHAHTKHLRLHTQVYTPEHKLVPDVNCPRCLKKFQTNLLFNCHECALKTLQCGGCNRILRQEAELLRHLPKCIKAYKTFNKNIPAAVAKLPLVDDKVHIKNENVIEANFAGQDAMLKHNINNTSDNNLKRINDMLSYTMQTLVSIKSEPAAQMDTESQINEEHSADYQFQNESHHNDDDDDNDNELDAAASISEPIVKLEVGETGSLPIPRLKIKREHGTLNSCLLNGQQSTQSTSPVIKEEIVETNNVEDNVVKMPLPGLVRIKQERLDEYEAQQEENNQEVTHNHSNTVSRLVTVKSEQRDTLFTPSLQIANVRSGVIFSGALGRDKLDIKPNREELDRFMHSKGANSSNNSFVPVNDRNKSQDTAENFANTIIKTEPTNDQEIIPKISLVSFGVNMSELGVRIKSEIKSEPCDYNENERVEEANDWQMQENSTNDVSLMASNIKQEKDKSCDTLLEISIKQEKILANENSAICQVTESDYAATNTVQSSTDPYTVVHSYDANTVDLSTDINSVNNSPVADTVDVSANANSDANTEEVSASTNSVDKDSDPNTVGGGINTSADLNTKDVSTGVNADCIEVSEPTTTVDSPKIDEESKECASVELETEDLDCQIICETETVGSVLKPSVNEVINLIDDSDSEIELETETADKTDEIKTCNMNDIDQSEATISGEIVEKDLSVDNAQPFTVPITSDSVHNAESVSDIDSFVAEQQNVLNQQRHSDMIVESSTVTDGNSSKTNNIEVTENVFNERVDAAVTQSPQAVASQPECINEQPAAQTVRFVNDRFLFDNSNINEIAENNNNANIERELLEVNAAAASAISPDSPLE